MARRAEHYDVIVAGGGSAGVAASVASARCGARTLLIERFGCLGGAATIRSVVTFCGLYTLGSNPRRVVGGIADDIVGRLKSESAISPPQRHRGVFAVFEPEVLKRVLDDLASEAGVSVMSGAFVCDATRRAGLLRSVVVASHWGMRSIAASAFVDCTGDGDLSSFSGASTRYGNDGMTNQGSLATRFGGIPADVEVKAEDITDAIDDAGFLPGDVTKNRSVVARLPHSGDMVVFLASEVSDPKDSMSKSAAERHARRQTTRYLEAIRRIPGCGNAHLALSGPEFGTRESRRLNCRHQLTWKEVETRTTFDDCIALGAWGSEWHDRKTCRSIFDFPPDKASYHIPLGCLHSSDTANLFCAGRLADGDRRAGAAIRVMGTAFATGQAAGVAAALEAQGSWTFHDLRARLTDQGAVLDAADAR